MPEKVLLDGTWEEVISMLQNVHALTAYNPNSIIGHYLKHLESNYQEWFPISLLSDIEISVENQTAIDKRIHKLIRNCCANDDDEEQYSGRYIIPLNFDFAAEAQVDMDYRTSSLMVTVWPGDTKWQGHCLLNKTANTLDWIYESEIIVDETPFEIITEPYLRLAHFQSSIIIEYLDKQFYKDNFGTDKEKCKKLFDDISRAWKRHEWDELRHVLLNKHKGLINENSFNEEFKAKFENSNRGYVHVSFGYETTIYIPMNIINKYEKQGSTEKDKDKLALLVSNIITALTDKIR